MAVRRRTAERGFTLIELMVVVAIITILVSLAIPRFQVVLLKGNLQEAVPYLQAIAARERIYFSKYGSYYPSGLEANLETTLGVELSDTGDFCFMVVTGTFIGTNTDANGFEVWAVLRNGAAGSVATVTPLHSGSPGNCTPSANKVASSFVNASQTELAGKGKIVALRYPDVASGPEARVGRTNILLDWQDGLAISDPLFEGT